jgi:hypothetical protein
VFLQYRRQRYRSPAVLKIVSFGQLLMHKMPDNKQYAKLAQVLTV